MYKIVCGSRGPKRSFVVTVGLREGYGSDAVAHPIDAAVEAAMEWMKARASHGQSFLTGTVTSGEVVYAWPEAPGQAGGGHEPTAIFSGEVSPLYAGHLSDEEVEVMLNELASHLGQILGQTRVYVAYRDETWVLQAEETATPTGETV